MKKIVALPLIAALALSVTACAKNAPADNTDAALNESVADNVSATDDLTSANATLGNDADLDTTGNSVVTTNTQ